MTSNVCPKCGNVIQSWANGNCYTCVRIQREYQIFGKRRPTKIKATQSKPSSNASLSTGVTKRGSQPIRRQSRRIAKKNASKNKSDNSRPVESQTPIIQMVAPLPKEGHDFLVQRKGINNLLKEIYGSQQYISQILRKKGVSPIEIKELGTWHINAYMANLCTNLELWLADILTARQFDLLIRLYALRRTPPQSLVEVQKVYRLELGTVYKLHIQVLNLLKQPKNINHLENIIQATAIQLLETESSHSFLAV